MGPDEVWRLAVIRELKRRRADIDELLGMMEGEWIEANRGRPAAIRAGVAQVVPREMAVVVPVMRRRGGRPTIGDRPMTASERTRRSREKKRLEREGGDGTD